MKENYDFCDYDMLADDLRIKNISKETEQVKKWC